MSLDVGAGGDDAVSVRRMETLEHEYKRLKRELLRDDAGGGGGDTSVLLDEGAAAELEDAAAAEVACSPPSFGPGMPPLKHSAAAAAAITRRRSTDKFLSIFGSDSHLNEEGEGRSAFAAASSPCGGGGDGKAFEDYCPHPTATSTRTFKADGGGNDDDEVARPLHDLADQLAELRLSLQTFERRGRLPSAAAVYTIPEEEGESQRRGGGGGGASGGEGGGKERDERREDVWRQCCFCSAGVLPPASEGACFICRANLPRQCRRA